MLEQIHRQKDSGFQLILNNIRNGICLNNAEWLALTAKKVPPNGAIAVKLMSRIAQVQAYNSKKLASIESEKVKWQARDLARKLSYSPEDRYEPRHSEIENRRRQYELSLSHGGHRFPAE
jgi:hypothetical protein